MDHWEPMRDFQFVHWSSPATLLATHAAAVKAGTSYIEIEHGPLAGSAEDPTSVLFGIKLPVSRDHYFTSFHVCLQRDMPLPALNTVYKVPMKLSASDLALLGRT